jgi:hypothetical protein
MPSGVDLPKNSTFFLRRNKKILQHKTHIVSIMLYGRGGCPKPFAGVEEHCRLVEGRSTLLKSDEKQIMRFYFKLRMNDLPLRNGVCIA